MAEVKRNFHVPLSEDLYRVLRFEAERQQRPATELAREVLEEWHKRLRAEALHRGIAEYASQNAGTSDDLDPALEAAGIDQLVGKAPKSVRRRKRAR